MEARKKQRALKSGSRSLLGGRASYASQLVKKTHALCLRSSCSHGAGHDGEVVSTALSRLKR